MQNEVSNIYKSSFNISRISVKSRALNPFLTIAQVFFAFFYIYEFNLSVWGFSSAITSRRIVVITMMLITIIKMLVHNKGISLDKYKSGYFNYVKFCIALLIYVGLLTICIGAGEGDSVAVDLIQLILFALIPVAFVPFIFKSTDEFLKIILLTAIIQTIIILLCQFNKGFCDFIDINFSTDYEYVYIHRATYAGGLGCITAPGLLRYSTGIFASLYFLFKKQKIKYFVLFLIFSFVGTMVARTGLVIMILGLLFILLFSFANGKQKLFIGLSLMTISLIGLFFILINTATIQNFLGANFRRLINLFNNGLKSEFLDGYFGDASGNVLPPVNAETFFGTGLINGVAGNGVKCIADGGYIRLFFAFGIPGVIFFYGYSLLALLNRTFKNKNDHALFWSLLFLIAIIFVGEFKEYLILNQYMIFISFSIFLLANKERGRV